MAEGKITVDLLHLKEVEELRAEVEALRESRSVWQSIETAPRDKPVLMWGKFWNNRDTFRRPMIGAWHEYQDRWVILGGTQYGVHPTHWMPLPDRPQVDAAIDAARDEK